MANNLADFEPARQIGHFVLSSSYYKTVADLLSTIIVQQQVIDSLTEQNAVLQHKLQESHSFRTIDEAKMMVKRLKARQDMKRMQKQS